MTALGLLCCLAASAQFSPVQHENDYQVYLNLHAEQDDRLPVEIVPPLLPKGTAVYSMPKMVPGTYSVYDFGRFVKDFKAYDSKGTELEVNQLNANQWEISEAEKLYRISYRVDDTFDDDSEPHIFEPGGTSFRKGEVFLLNLFGMLGYIEGKKNVPFELDIDVPPGMYGGTAMEDLDESAERDHFSTPDYFELHDNPILYAKADTASLMVKNTEVIVAVWSENGIIQAKEAMDASAPVLKAIGDYLGGTLPTDRYAILLYFAPPDLGSNMGYGALEHHKSTVVTMPEFESPELYEEVRHIVAHEFLHIVTPLSLHSEYINDFDFSNPSMSQHLWLYEGVTEYTSLLVQVRDGLMTRQEFLDDMEEKMRSAESYNKNIPFTVMSRFVLDYFKDEYLNVYQYGSVIGMGLDLKLRNLSNGSYGLRDLLQQLGNTFGPDTFFADVDLFDLMAEASGYPDEIREFFARHVEGTEPIPFADLLAPFGIEYREKSFFQRPSLGGFSFGFNQESGNFMVTDVTQMDAFGRAMGFEDGDEILEWNGKEFNAFSAQQIVEEHFGREEGEKVKVVVKRTDSKGRTKEKTLKGKITLVEDSREHVMLLKDEQPAPLRGNWMGNPNNN